ncbi:MAG: FHA domain-containing protein [Kofleriaceae bacterium]
MADPSTNADPTGTGWAINDLVVRLRLLGSERAFDLSSARQWVVGASPECTIQLDDPSGRVSRRHAVLHREGDTWLVRDLGSTNGIRHDGEATRAFSLSPGAEIELGGIAMIAESARSIELHALLRRVLGWSLRCLADVDRALGVVRDMANLRTGLILRGEGSLVGAARRLHHLVLGPERPFVLRKGDEMGIHAAERAVSGVLCFDADALPPDLREVVASLRLPETRVRLIVCARTAESSAEVATIVPRVATLWIPPLAERGDEMEQLLEAYGRDAVTVLDAAELGFRQHDLKWVRASGIRTLEEIEEVTYRLVALRNWGVTAGAERLGITHGALSRWARRRKIPT